MQEPAGLARQTEKPFQAVIAHPWRRLRDSAGMEKGQAANGTGLEVLHSAELVFQEVGPVGY